MTEATISQLPRRLTAKQHFKMNDRKPKRKQKRRN